MYQFQVALKDAHEFRSLGVQEFQIPPRAHEYVVQEDPDDVSPVYRVWAVIHHLKPDEIAGTLILEAAGDEIDLARSFL